METTKKNMTSVSTSTDPVSIESLDSGVHNRWFPGFPEETVRPQQLSTKHESDIFSLKRDHSPTISRRHVDDDEYQPDQVDVSDADCMMEGGMRYVCSFFMFYYRFGN